VVLEMTGVQAGVLAVVNVGVGNEVAQVVVSLAGGGQQSQMGAILEGNLYTGNGLDIQAPGHLSKMHGAAQVVMIGEGQGRIAQLSGPYQELLYRRSPFLKGIIRMTVQFDVAHTQELGILPVPRPIHQVPKDSNASAVFSNHQVIHSDNWSLPPPLFIDATQVIYRDHLAPASLDPDG
jgi:hypothetical protein